MAGSQEVFPGINFQSQIVFIVISEGKVCLPGHRVSLINQFTIDKVILHPVLFMTVFSTLFEHFTFTLFLEFVNSG